MTRPYHRNEPEPVITTEFVEPESIVYEYGCHHTTLVGFLANLYRGQIWMYGEAEAKERFWHLFYIKNSVSSPENTVPAL